ncbi:hypothetical protein [Pseudomonas sp. NA-150]|uniref:hypothetical protein n=1 Tax=Pseudomonas sp. NA-150 TaxID=3367525 RepID=UPI0037C7EA65
MIISETVLKGCRKKTLEVSYGKFLVVRAFVVVLSFNSLYEMDTRGIAMKSKSVGFMVCTLMLSTFSGTVLANGGALRFSGQMVATGCDVLPMTGQSGVDHGQQMPLAQHVTLVVDTRRVACGERFVPFQAVYGVVHEGQANVSAVPAISPAAHGLVTLTYQ